MARVTRLLKHPIIFILDFDCEEVYIPEHDRTQIVSFNEFCLSVRAMSDVDGSVQIALNEGSSGVSMIEVFAGTLNTPSRRIAIVSSSNEKLLETEVPENRTGVVVLVDEKNFPSRIEVSTFDPQPDRP